MSGLPDTSEVNAVEPPRPIKRRKRKPVACIMCRARKLKCDRNHPSCSNCISRAEEGYCDYGSSVSAPSLVAGPKPTSRKHDGRVRKDGDDSTVSATAMSPAALAAKLHRLENMIQSLTGGGGSTSTTETRGDGASASAIDVLSPKSTTDEAATSNSEDGPQTDPQVGDACWVRLMNEVAEMRAHVCKASPPTPQPSSSTTAFFFGAASMSSPAQILRQLPSRYFCDRMVSVYFDNLDPVLAGILHKPTFLQEYEAFWEQKHTLKSMTWPAVLFGVMRIAILVWLRDNTEPAELRGTSEDMSTLLRICAAECVAQADYQRPQQHLISALLLQLFADYSATRDLNPSVWVLHATIVRISMRAGYHLPPERFRDLSPFQGEMRRRAWAFICQADILLSSQSGFHSMIDPSHFDVSLPSNLADEDIEPTSSVLPLPRPQTEVTVISFLIAKVRLAFTLARMLKEVEQLSQISYPQVLTLDHDIRNCYQTVPDYWRIDKLPEDLLDGPLVMTARFVLASIYHKTLCLLHSKYLKNCSEDDQQYLYSRIVSLDSATALLAMQAYSHKEFIMDGQRTSLARFQTSLTIHDYFLATTILCAALNRYQRASPLSITSAEPTKENLLATLYTSIALFKRMSSGSDESRRAYTLLSALVHEYQRPSNVGKPLRSGVLLETNEVGMPALPTPNTSTTTDFNQPALPSSYLHSDDILQWGDWDASILDMDFSADPISYFDNLHWNINL